MKKLKALHIPLWRGSKIIHIATIRNDWEKGDFDNLKELFKDCCLRSRSLICPIWLIGEKYHDTDFKHLGKFAWIPNSN